MGWAGTERGNIFVSVTEEHLSYVEWEEIFGRDEQDENIHI